MTGYLVILLKILKLFEKLLWRDAWTQEVDPWLEALKLMFYLVLGTWYLTQPSYTVDLWFSAPVFKNHATCSFLVTFLCIKNEKKNDPTYAACV